MNAQDILALKKIDASTLFSGDEKSVKRLYRKLIMDWHPDHNSSDQARDVFGHLTELKNAALGKLGAVKPRAELLMSKAFMKSGPGLSGGFNFKYLVNRTADLGDVYIGKSSLAYEIPDGFDDIAGAERNRLQNFKFADAAMEKEIKRFLPKQREYWDLGHNGIVSVIERPVEYLLLADLINHYNGQLPAVHVAWIVSSLMNMACYLKWAGICHGAVSPSNILVSPKWHSIMLVGGWGFATEFGKRPLALPERTTSILPKLVVSGTPVDEKVDLQLIRATAQDLLGCPGGGGLHMNADVPVAMREWLLLPPADGAFKDYAGWSACLDKSYGKRKFVEMNVTPADVYGA